MTKTNLKAGYLIETDEGKRGILMPYSNGLVIYWAGKSPENSTTLNNYSCNLSHRNNYHLDIDKVYGFSDEPEEAAHFTTDSRSLLWKRGKTWKLTLYEEDDIPLPITKIEETYGYRSNAEGTKTPYGF